MLALERKRVMIRINSFFYLPSTSKIEKRGSVMSQNLLLSSVALFALGIRVPREIPDEYQPALLLPTPMLKNTTICARQECSKVIIVENSVCVLIEPENKGGSLFHVCCSLECLLEFMPTKGCA
jgi:hypothetical protein